MKLIETDEFVKAARLGRIGGTSAARVLMTVLRIKKINKLYDSVSHHRGIDFIDALIDKLQLEFEVSEEELKKLEVKETFFIKRDRGSGRPTKKERRIIDKLRSES